MSIEDAVNIEDLRRLARRHTPRAVFGYVEGGVEDEIGMARNRASLDAVRLVPRYLTDTSARTQKTTLFGREYAMPLGIAPMGLSGISRPGTDLALASAAGQAGIPFTLSNVSNEPLDKVVAAIKGFQKGYQGGVWKLSPLLEKLAAEGKTFTDYDARK